MKKRINMDINENLWKRVGVKAAESGITKRDLVERALESHLERDQKEEKNVAKNYRVEAYRYLKGPHEDPISNMRHSQKSVPWFVLETDVLDEAIAKVKEIEAEDESVRAYVIRTSDGAQYGGGLWLE